MSTSKDSAVKIVHFPFPKHTVISDRDSLPIPIAMNHENTFIFFWLNKTPLFFKQ